MGLGMPIPDLSNKPGPGRPGYPTGAFEFKLQIEGTGTFTFTGSKAGGGQNFSIDWGDQTTASGLTGTSHTHTYSTAGPHILMINNEEDSGPINIFQITAGETLVTKVLNWGTTAWNNLTAAFSGCTNLTTLEDSALTTDSNGDMYDCFNGCTGLTTVNGKKWNLSAGARIGRWFNGCTNLELLDLTGVSINLIEASDDAFQSSGSTTTDGCEFKLSGVTLTQSSTLSHDDWFRSTKLKPTSTFTNIIWPSTRFNGTNWFYEAVMTGTNSVLDCSGWTTFKGELSYWFSRFNNVGGGVNPSNTNQKINLTNFSGDLLAGGLNQFMANSAVSEIIGLSTWGATSGTPISFQQAFLGARVFSIDANDNFSNTFMSSAVVNSMLGFYANVGDDYNGTPVFGVAPNLTGLDVSNATSFQQAFMSTRLTSNIDFNNITYGSTAYSFSQTFQAYYGQTYAGSHIDFSNAALKISSLSSAFFSYGQEVLEKVTFGNNVDFSELTSFSHAFYNFGRGANGTILEFPTNADYSALTNVTNMFFNTNYPYTIPALSTCQVDYFIRNLYSSRQSLGAGGALTINMPGMSVTAAPSLVRSTLDDLTTLGYNITLGATDAALPFSYPSYAFDPSSTTSVTPNLIPSGALFSTTTSGVTVNQSTGEVSWASTFSGSINVKCTYTDGCYNEVTILVQVPFVMRTKIPAGGSNFTLSPQMSNGECFIDWGDTNSETLTGSTTHSYATSGSDQEYDIKLFDSANGSKFTGFASAFGDTEASYEKTILQWGDIEWQNNQWFGTATRSAYRVRIGAPNGASHKPNLSQVTSLYRMFGTSETDDTDIGTGFFEDTNDNLEHWDVSTITNMSYMFRNPDPIITKDNGDPNILKCSNWDVSNVANFNNFMSGFSGAVRGSWNTKTNIDMTNWDTSGATDMSYMFWQHQQNKLGIENFRTENVTNLSHFYGGGTWNAKTKMYNGILRWDVSNVENFSSTSIMVGNNETDYNANFPNNWRFSTDASKNLNFYNFCGGDYMRNGAGPYYLTDLQAFATKTINETFYGGTSYTAWNMDNASSISNFGGSTFRGGPPLGLFRNYNIADWNITSKCTSFNNLWVSGRAPGGAAIPFDQDLSGWNVTGITGNQGFFMRGQEYTPLNDVNMSRSNYDATLTAWGALASSVNSGVTVNFGTSKFTGNNVAIGTATVNGTSTNLIAGGSPFSSSMVGGIVTLTSGTNSGQQAKITTFNSASSVTISRAINLQAEQNTFTVDTTDAAKGRFALSDPDGPAWIITDGGKEVPFDPLKLQVRVPANSSLAFSFAKIISPSNVNATLKWGDGQESTINTVNSIPTHTYTNNTGSDVDYELELNQGSDSVYCTGFRFDDNLDATSRAAVRNLTQWGSTSWVSMASAFKTCSNFDITATDGPVITSNTNLTHSFGSCTSLVNSNGSIGNWDVSQLTALYVTFDGCTSFNVDISKWDTSSVGNMNNTFLNCTSFNQDLSTKYITAGNSPTGSAYWAWNTSSVSNMGSVFKGATNFNCGSNANGLSNWNTSSATTMFEMFKSSGYNKPLNTNLVPAASSYSGSDYVAWDVDNVVDFREMFRDNTSFNQDIGKWKFKSTGTIAFNYMLKGATAFAQDISTKTITAGNSPYGTQYTAWDISRASSLTRVIAGTNVNVFLNWSVGQWSTYALHSWGGASAAGGLSVANYTDQIVKWANDVNAAGKSPTGIYAVINSDGATVPNYDSTRTYGSGFANAGRARSYLSLDVSVSGLSGFNGTYYYDYATGQYINESDSTLKFVYNTDESVCELQDEEGAQHSGSGGSQANGPTSATWSGFTVSDASAGWTFNGTVTT